DRYLPYRLKVHDVIKKYFKVKQAIKDEVEQIYNQKMAGFYSIGVHVRYGSDHASEAPKGNPSVEDYIAEVKSLLLDHPFQPVRIYLATDSHFVVKVFQEAFPSDWL